MGIDINTETKGKIALISAIFCALGGACIGSNIGAATGSSVIGAVIGFGVGYASPFISPGLAFVLILVSCISMWHNYNERFGPKPDPFADYPDYSSPKPLRFTPAPEEEVSPEDIKANEEFLERARARKAGSSPAPEKKLSPEENKALEEKAARLLREALRSTPEPKKEMSPKERQAVLDGLQK
jgi:hypothetical protein